MTDIQSVAEQQLAAEQGIAESPDAKQAAEKRQAALAGPEKRDAAPKGRRAAAKSTVD